MNILKERQEVYALKQLVTIEKLRQYRRECAVADLLERMDSIISRKTEPLAF